MLTLSLVLLIRNPPFHFLPLNDELNDEVKNMQGFLMLTLALVLLIRSPQISSPSF